MRYFLTGFILCLTAFAWADSSYNESVAAISYNPSRLGAYSHLKIVHDAEFSGLDACTANNLGQCTADVDVNIMSTGSGPVTIQNQRKENGEYVPSDAGKCKANSKTESNTACYTIEEILPMAQNNTYCEGHSDFCESTDFFSALETNSHTVVENKDDTYLVQENLPNIEADSVWSGSNANWPLDNNGITLHVEGGTLESGSSSRAFVKQLDGELTNITLDASSNLIMNPGTTITVTDSFKLGRVTISVPPNGSQARSFVWHQRTDATGAKAKVLAYCTKSSGC